MFPFSFFAKHKISAIKLAAKAVEQLPKLRGCEIHNTEMLYSGDLGTIRRLGMNSTSEPEFPEKSIN